MVWCKTSSPKGMVVADRRRRTAEGPRWRIQCRRGCLVFREASGPGSWWAGKRLFDRIRKELEEETGTNVELQERPRGCRRYRLVLEAIGRELITW